MRNAHVPHRSENRSKHPSSLSKQQIIGIIDDTLGDMQGMARRSGVRTREALQERGGPCAQLAESGSADDEIAMHPGQSACS